jgi:hypothetical protein
MALTKEYEGDKDYGAMTRNTFKIVKNKGACRQILYPEPGPTMSWEEYIDTSKIPAKCYEDALKHKSQSFWRVNLIVDEMKQVLAEKKTSIVISMAWYKEFNYLPDGKMPTTFKDYVGGHAVEIMGYDDKERYFIVKNSWGQGWGKDGKFFLPYDYLPKLVWDAWSSLDIEENLPVDSYYGQKRTWDAYLREKAIAFNPWLHKKIGRLPNNREISATAYGFWDFETVFLGVNGDIWLKITKPEAIKRGLIK